ncbi:MAG: hypothetical protein FJ146_08665 [Deltaproteobacteria bacterium]|nr:hypothetical protein [Deltaproteobacteria bacterium]
MRGIRCSVSDKRSVWFGCGTVRKLFGLDGRVFNSPSTAAPRSPGQLGSRTSPSLEAEGRPVPERVAKELRGFLTCGILQYGFVLAFCPGCFCPSCFGKRMAESVKHLVDHVLPHAPYRQWVLTFPFRGRLPDAGDRGRRAAPPRARRSQ